MYGNIPYKRICSVELSKIEHENSKFIVNISIYRGVDV